MTKSKVNIKDVAARANVSVGTVSHVLTGRASVSERLKKRVEQAIKELGFVPNFSAQGLKARHNSVIGVCFPHSSTAYLNGLSETLEQNAARNGCSILHVFSRQDPKAEFCRIRELLDYRVGGLVLFPSSAPEETLDLVHRQGVPLVVVNRPTDLERFDHVILDHQKTMQRATELLISRGHRNILFVSRSRHNSITQHRVEAMLTAKRQSPYEVVARTLEYGDNERNLGDKLARLMRGRNPPSAIVASNSHQALLTLVQLRNLSIKCPEEVSVLGFDDPEWGDMVVPRLSVIRQPARAIANMAWDFLMSRMRDINVQPRVVAFEAEIELRDSVAMIAGGVVETAESPAELEAKTAVGS